MSMMMSDLNATKYLFNKNNINFQETQIYNDHNEWCGYALWLDTGHIEFSVNGKIENIVTF